MRNLYLSRAVLASFEGEDAAVAAAGCGGVGRRERESARCRAAAADAGAGTGVAGPAVTAAAAAGAGELASPRRMSTGCWPKTPQASGASAAGREDA